jgi:hypothetical protein
LTKYFPVHIDSLSTNVVTDIEELLATASLQDNRRNAAQHIIPLEQNKVDFTPWLKRTRWPLAFAGKDMKEVVLGISKPEKNDLDLIRAWNSVIRLISVRCMDGVQDCLQRHWEKLLFWLNSMDITKASTKPFSQHYEDDTVNKYATLWAQLICLCLRATNDPDRYEVPLTSSQRLLLQQLADLLEGDGHDDEVDEVVLEVSTMLIQLPSIHDVITS